MNILIAPDKFKECLSADEAARLMARGVRRALPGARVRRLPLADGGDGTAETLTRAMGGRFRRTRVAGPLGGPVWARWGWVRSSRNAVLEMAGASGLALVPRSRRDPLKTSTRGTGQLIRAALDAGVREILIGLGGSATVDAGLGALQALGARVFLKGGGELRRPAAGRDLAMLERVDVSGLDPRLGRVRIRALCDVDNPLAGPAGAARVYGPQKGATPAQVRLLERSLKRFTAVVKAAGGRDVSRMPRAGAAGGLAAGLHVFLRARLEPGAERILDLLKADRDVRWADAVLTGEGSADGQSVRGKVFSGLARLARRRKKPLLVLAGRLGLGWRRLLRAGARCVRAVAPGLSREESLRRTPDLLPGAAGALVREAKIERRSG